MIILRYISTEDEFEEKKYPCRLALSRAGDFKPDLRKHHKHTLKTNHGTVRKSHRSLTVTRHQKDNLSKATSSLFPIKMTTKLGHKVLNNTRIKTEHQQQWTTRMRSLWGAIAYPHAS